MRLSIARAAVIAGLFASCAGVIAAPAPVRPHHKTVRVRPSVTPPSQPWAQLKSDVPVDRSLRFGTLPNGFRYVIRHNATPPGQSTMFLRIDAGSLMEQDNQLGLAHFMEHMAFNGTTHIPKSELITTLQQLGLAFGADLNAFTGFDETVYQLNLPRADDATLDTGLHVLLEQVSQATMARDSIDSERGVIRGEERLRNTPSQRVSLATTKIVIKDQKVADRAPIGDMKIVDTAPRESFVNFYDAYYRPERATLIAVGDFDVDKLEAKIRARYGAWTPRGPAGPLPDLGKVAPRGEETHVVVEPSVAPNASMFWTQPFRDNPDTLAQRRSDIVNKLVQAVLNRRFQAMARGDHPPFLEASFAVEDMVRSLRMAALGTGFARGHWQDALAALEQEQRRLVRYGVTDAELQREIEQQRTVYRTAVTTAPTRDTRTLTAGLLGAVNDRQVATTPETDLAIFESAVNGLTADKVNPTIAPMFAGNGPVVVLASPKPVEGGEQAVAAVLHASRQVAVAAPEGGKKPVWAYTDFGPAGAVASRREVPELGATIVTFANGTTLTVKSTNFDKAQIGVTVMTGGGELNYPRDRFDERAGVMNAFSAGGLGRMPAQDIDRSLSGHVYGLKLNVGGDSFSLSGATRPEDLTLQLQLMTAYLTDPALRAGPFDKLKASYVEGYDQSLASPEGAFKAAANGLIAGGDQRAAIIPPSVLSTFSADDARPAIRKMLSEGPVHVTMVGDVTIDLAIAATAATFGALPPRVPLPPPPPGADQRHFPAPTPTPLRFTHNGLAEQGLGYIAWPTTDAIHDLTEGRRITLLSAVLQMRVLDEIRERLSLAYSPSVAVSFSESYPGYGGLAVAAATTPEKVPAFFQAVDDIVRRLRDEPISAEDMKRARQPIIEQVRRSRSDNSWWLSKLIRIVDRPYYIPQTLTALDQLEAMTPADIQALARKYLRPEAAWKAEVMPRSLSAAGTPTKPSSDGASG